MSRTAENPCRFLATEILRVVPCERIAFVVHLPDGSGYRIAGAYPDASAFPDLVIPAQGSCTSQVIAQRRGRLLSAIGEESRFAEEEPLYRAGIRDAIFVPLFRGAEVMGAVIVGRTEVNSLEPRALKCLERISGLLAAVLAASLEASAASGFPVEMAFTAPRIAGETDLDRVCRLLLETIRRHTPFRRVVLTLLDEAVQPYQWFFTGMTEEEMEAANREGLKETELRALFQGTRPTISLPRPAGRSLVPLTGSRERPLGYLTLEAPGDGEAPTAGHRGVVEMMASLAGVALERNQCQLELRRERGRLQKSQEQLVHSEKLAALGQMVSGVAHELNNPLAGVVGFAELALKGGGDPKVEKNLQRIVHESRRCQHIVGNLLNFARRTKSERRPMNLNEIVETVLDLRSYQLRLDDIAVVRKLAPDLPPTLGDGHQIQQVLLNIINNAHQAMMEIEGERVLTLRTRVEGGRIQIRIEDTGPGISPSALSKIFEPFFTTKPEGQGTGLGLSLSLGLVRDHGGQIRVESLVGKGTAFIVELPIHEVQEETAAVRPVGRPAEAGASRSILVVDDEEVIVDLLHEVLTTAGHKVDSARDGRQALDKILAQGYDAVITDLKMPGLDGTGLYDSVCRRRPEMAGRFVFSSGDLGSSASRDFFEKTGCPCLSKPFDLLTVRDTLDRIFSRP